MAFVTNLTFAQPTQEYDPLKGSTLVSAVGTSNILELNFRDQLYELIFTVKENSSEKGLVIDYVSAEAKSIISMSPNAVKNAVNMDYRLSGAEIKLDDKTIGWVSKKVQEDLMKTGEAEISADGGRSLTVIKRKYFNHDFSVKTKAGMQSDIAYMYCENDDEDIKFWIQTGENPLILKLDLGWAVMTLNQFKEAGE